MPTLYDQVLKTLGAEPPLQLYIIYADDGTPNSNSGAVLATSFDEAYELFLEDMDEDDWSWTTAEIFRMSPSTGNPRLLAFNHDEKVFYHNPAASTDDDAD